MFWRNLDRPRDCARARRLLADRSVGLLGPSQQRWLDRHLHLCHQCRQEEALLHRVLDLVDGVPPVLPPPDLWSGIHARIRTPQPISVWRTYAPAAALCAAAGVALALSLRASSPMVPAFDPPPADSISYIENHALTAREGPFADQIGLVSYVVLTERTRGVERGGNR